MTATKGGSIAARRRRAVVEWMLWGTGYAFVFPFLTMAVWFHLGVFESFAAALITAFIGGPCMTWVFLVLVPYTRRLPFALAMLLQIGSILLVVSMGFFLAGVVIASIHLKASPFSSAVISGAWENLASPPMTPAYAIALFLMIFMTGLGQINAKLGPGVLWGWMAGRYHRPREEERIFMFLDVRDSTPLAEQLGNLKFSALIQMFFRDLGDCLSERKGAVSHFIGDEAVIFWKPSDAANCVRFFFDLQEQIEERALEYERRFGVVPSFKAGAHVGPVVAVEVSAGKSEIVLHGDAVNTTARIAGMCAELGRDFLISGELARRLPSCDLASLGEFVLKGKAEKVELFG